MEQHLIRGVLLKLKKLQDDTTGVKAATALIETGTFLLMDLDSLITALETVLQVQEQTKTPPAATDSV